MKIATTLLFAMGIATSLANAVRAAAPATLLLPEEDEIRLALESGPEHLRAQATVYVFGSDGYRKVRTGSNGFTCFVNRDGNQNGDAVLRPTCWDAEGTRTIVPVMLRVGEMLARKATAEAIKQDVEAGFASGTFSSPQKAGIAYMLLGDIEFDPATKQISKKVFPPHYMIYAPGVTNADIGMTVRNAPGQYALPLVFSGYSGGSRTAYIIVLAAPRQEHSH